MKPIEQFFTFHCKLFALKEARDILLPRLMNGQIEV
jgi:hypothetical protein